MFPLSAERLKELAKDCRQVRWSTPRQISEMLGPVRFARFEALQKARVEKQKAFIEAATMEVDEVDATNDSSDPSTT